MATIHPKNAKRARRASRALRSEYRNGGGARVHKDDVVDILADLRHLCTRAGWDFADLDRIAYQHYIEEQGRRA